MNKINPKLKLGCPSCEDKLKNLNLDSLRKVEIKPTKKETSKITTLRGKERKNKNALF